MVMLSYASTTLLVTQRDVAVNDGPALCDLKR